MAATTSPPQPFPCVDARHRERVRTAADSVRRGRHVSRGSVDVADTSCASKGAVVLQRSSAGWCSRSRWQPIRIDRASLAARATAVHESCSMEAAARVHSAVALCGAPLREQPQQQRTARLERHSGLFTVDRTAHCSRVRVSVDTHVRRRWVYGSTRPSSVLQGCFA
jgi:hypothetical protein|eukprot:949416-Prymnesium_polylepis.1